MYDEHRHCMNSMDELNIIITMSIQSQLDINFNRSQSLKDS